jgi:hypothetical protein
MFETTNQDIISFELIASFIHISLEVFHSWW